MSSAALNRVTETKTKRYIAGGTNDWQWTKITHGIDAIGRTAFSNYRQWLNGGSEPSGDSLEHVYDQQGRFVQNYDRSSVYGTAWRWAGAANSHIGPLYGPAADTASQDNHNVGAASFKGIPVRRSFTQPTVEGDKRELYGQGRPQAKDSVGAWATGVSSDPQNIAQGTAESRFSFIGTVSSTDMSRATDSREAGRIGIFGSALSYGGSYGRVTNEAIGRDVNPLGRGDGLAYLGGSTGFGEFSPVNMASISVIGTGSSVNNASSKSLISLLPHYYNQSCWDSWSDELTRYPGEYPCTLLPACPRCPGWLCSGQSFLLEPALCASRFCRWQDLHGAKGIGCGECYPWLHFTFYCYPYWSGNLCFDCDKFDCRDFGLRGRSAMGLRAASAFKPYTASECGKMRSTDFYADWYSEMELIKHTGCRGCSNLFANTGTLACILQARNYQNFLDKNLEVKPARFYNCVSEEFLPIPADGRELPPGMSTIDNPCPRYCASAQSGGIHTCGGTVGGNVYMCCNNLATYQGNGMCGGSDNNVREDYYGVLAHELVHVGDNGGANVSSCMNHGSAYNEAQGLGQCLANPDKYLWQWEFSKRLW